MSCSAATTFLGLAIRPGYPAALSLPFAASAVAEYPLMTGRLLSHFRYKVSSPAPLFVLDSDISPLSFARTLLTPPDPDAGGVTLQLNLTALQTILIAQSQVTFDIAHTPPAGVQRLIPVRWIWPALLPVTR
jgi:hypothetical protein